LGIDILPHKTCPFDCIYCQLGETDRHETAPREFFAIDDILDDVREALDDGPTPDVITFAGSGEPTLYSRLGELIDRLEEEWSIPVLLITNSALLWREEVAAAAMKTDGIAPSLDAGDPETFARINRPAPGVSFDKVIEGLERVTNAHPGEVHLEVMLVDGVNDSETSLRAIADLLRRMRFERLDINTPVRPPVPERGALPCTRDVLERAMALFGPKARPIGTFADARKAPARAVHSFSDLDKDIRGTLLRRPCTINDIAASLGLHRGDVIASLERLAAAGLIASRQADADTYYHTETDSLIDS